MKIYTTNTPVGKISVLENDSIFSNQLKNLGKYVEQDIIDNYLKPYVENAKTILDIGGHVGYHSLAYRKLNSEAIIHTFEPQAEIFDLLNKNLLDNNSQNIFTYNKAVGHINTQITLSDVITDGPNANKIFNYGTSEMFNLAGVSIGFGRRQIDMISLDSMNFKDVNYIKVDVEGAESLVFFGGENTIKKFKPIICFEHNHKKLDDKFVFSLYGSELPNPIEVLRSFGYTKFTKIPYENIIATT